VTHKHEIADLDTLADVGEFLGRVSTVQRLVVLHEQVGYFASQLRGWLHVIILIEVGSNDVLLVHRDLSVNNSVGVLIVAQAFLRFGVCALTQRILQQVEETLRLSRLALCFTGLVGGGRVVSSILFLLLVNETNSAITFLQVGVLALSLGLSELLLGEDRALGHVLLLEAIGVDSLLSLLIDLELPLLLVLVDQVLDLESHVGLKVRVLTLLEDNLEHFVDVFDIDELAGLLGSGVRLLSLGLVLTLVSALIDSEPGELEKHLAQDFDIPRVELGEHFVNASADNVSLDLTDLEKFDNQLHISVHLFSLTRLNLTFVEHEKHLFVEIGLFGCFLSTHDSSIRQQLVSSVN